MEENPEAALGKGVGVGGLNRLGINHSDLNNSSVSGKRKTEGKVRTHKPYHLDTPITMACAASMVC